MKRAKISALLAILGVIFLLIINLAKTPKETRFPASEKGTFAFSNVKIDKESLSSVRGFVHNKSDNVTTVTGHLMANELSTGDYFIRAANDKPGKVGPIQIYTITKLPFKWPNHLWLSAGYKRQDDLIKLGKDDDCQTTKTSSEDENLCIHEHVAISFENLEEFNKYVVSKINEGRVNELGSYRFSLLSPGMVGKRYTKITYDISGNYIMEFMSEIQRYTSSVEITSETATDVLAFTNSKTSREQMRSIKGFVHNKLKNITTVTGHLMANELATGDYFIRAASTKSGKVGPIQIYTITKLPFKWPNSLQLWDMNPGRHYRVWLPEDSNCSATEQSDDDKNLCVDEHVAITFETLEEFMKVVWSAIENKNNVSWNKNGYGFKLISGGIGKIDEKYRSVEYKISSDYVMEFVQKIQQYTVPQVIAEQETEAQL